MLFDTDKLSSISKVIPIVISLSFAISILYNIIYFFLCNVFITEIPLTIQDYILSFQGWILVIIAILFCTLIPALKYKQNSGYSGGTRSQAISTAIVLIVTVVWATFIQYHLNSAYMFYTNLFFVTSIILILILDLFKLSKYARLYIIFTAVISMFISLSCFYIYVSFILEEYSVIRIKDNIQRIIILRNLEQGVFGYTDNGSLIFIFKNGDKIIYNSNYDLIDIKRNNKCFFKILCRHENKCK